MTLLFGLFVGTVLVLSGVGLGTVGATVIGMSKLADLQKQASASGASALSPGPSGAKPAPSAGSSASPRDRAQHRPKSLPKERPSLGVEAVDATGGPGALLVGVHVPGPAHTAGLVRGDVLLVVGGTRIDSAADLARAVATARPGRTVTLTVRHASGGYQQLTATPGVIT